MKKTIIAFLTACVITVPSIPAFSNAAEAEKLTFNDYMSMTNEEVALNYQTEKLTECSFGDETVEDDIKFEKYLNTPPAFYTGNNYCSPDYGAYMRFITGEVAPYITFYVNMNTQLLEMISPDEFGYTSDWRIETVEGKWVVEMADGTKTIHPIHEYRLYVPVEVISDFETYIRLEASNQHFTDIEQNNNYGIYYCEDIVGQFKSYGEAEAIIDGNIVGDANLDGKTTVADAVAILQHIGNRDKYGLKPQGLINADVDGVAGVTANDARVLQEWDANK